MRFGVLFLLALGTRASHIVAMSEGKKKRKRKVVARTSAPPFKGDFELIGSRSGRYEIVGTTSDGVKVLRSKTRPSHFTPDEIRTTIRDFRGQRKHG